MQHEGRSLAEVHETVEVPSRGPWWRRWLAISGPALIQEYGTTTVVPPGTSAAVAPTGELIISLDR